MARYKISLALMSIFAWGVAVLHAQGKPRSHKQQDNNLIYRIQRDDQLYSISIYLYGHPKYASKLADINSLERPYRLDVGRKLRLHRKPTLSPEEGHQALLEYWRRALNKNHIPKLERGNGRRRKQKKPRPPLHTPIQKFEPSPTPTPVIQETPTEAPPPPPPKAEVIQALKTEAIAEITADMPKSQIDAESALEHARQLQSEEKWRESIIDLMAAREADPQLVPAWLLELKALKKLGDFETLHQRAHEFREMFPKLKKLPIANPEEGTHR